MNFHLFSILLLLYLVPNVLTTKSTKDSSKLRLVFMVRILNNCLFPYALFLCFPCISIRSIDTETEHQSNAIQKIHILIAVFGPTVGDN